MMSYSICLRFFLMWTIFKVFIGFVTLLLLFYVLVFWPRGMWDVSSPTRDQTCTPCIGRWSRNHCSAREVYCVYSWGLLGYSLLFLWCLWLEYQDNTDLTKWIENVFPPLLFFWIVCERLVSFLLLIFGRIHQWSQLVFPVGWYY